MNEFSRRYFAGSTSKVRTVVQKTYNFQGPLYGKEVSFLEFAKGRFAPEIISENPSDSSFVMEMAEGDNVLEQLKNAPANVNRFELAIQLIDPMIHDLCQLHRICTSSPPSLQQIHP